MKLKSLLLASLLTTVTACVNVQDTPVGPDPITEEGVVKITWQDPKKYTDIVATSELQSRFEKQIFTTLTADLNILASKVLKPGEMLVMKVTNVDLAGDVRPTFGETSNNIRVVKDVYPPRIAFSYKVMQGNRVVMSGQEKLQDMFFMGGIQPLTEKPFMYEANLLKHWFNKSISPRFDGAHQSNY